jgi:hypothetical protein
LTIREIKDDNCEVEDKEYEDEDEDDDDVVVAIDDGGGVEFSITTYINGLPDSISNHMLYMACSMKAREHFNRRRHFLTRPPNVEWHLYHLSSFSKSSISQALASAAG